MRRNPPGFVAVSLDGPEKVHDRFRGSEGAFRDALRAIAVFSGLDGCSVAAGTTVTTFNFPHLSRTFPIVVESGASGWGIHLLVPEGRAERRKDLFLSRRQLGRLVKFVAAKRNYFPVAMADEIGYCGDLEPLLRDGPLVCGAGRAQCVVLPDGSVVPCTTLDRSTSAGNIHDRPLSEIWRDGFADLRRWRPEGECRRCDYASACGGGCWLQLRSRRRKQCYRDVWHVPEAIKTAAGVAVCLGVAVSAAAQRAPVPPARPLTGAHTASKAPQVAAETGGSIERAILLWYAHPLVDPRRRVVGFRGSPELPPGRITGKLAEDPAGVYFQRFVDGRLPRDLPGLCKAINDCLKTEQRSLSLSALLWRNLTECLLDGAGATKRTQSQRKMLREILAAMAKATGKWRKEIFDKKLDPYLARGRKHLPYRFEMSKAMIPTPPWLTLARDTAMERWGGKGARNVKAEALEGWLERHPYGEDMALRFALDEGVEIAFVSAAGKMRVKGEGAWGIYDVAVVPKEAANLKLTVRGPGKKGSYEIALPAGAELTYADLLRLAYAQHTRRLDEAAGRTLSAGSRVHHAKSPLLLPAVRKLGAYRPACTMRRTYKRDVGCDTARLWLADFWMF